MDENCGMTKIDGGFCPKLNPQNGDTRLRENDDNFEITNHNDHEDPYPSLSDYHDYEPNLEFDDTELQHATVTSGALILEA
ncbi:hypothetical protein L9F63_006300, partial [Diploptera punctata]